MLRKKKLLAKYCFKIFKFSIPISIGLFLLRINGLLSFLPGGILLFLIIISLFTLLGYLILKTYN